MSGYLYGSVIGAEVFLNTPPTNIVYRGGGLETYKIKNNEGKPLILPKEFI